MAHEKQHVSQPAPDKKTSEAEEKPGAPQPVSQNGDRAEGTTPKLAPAERVLRMSPADNPSAKRQISFKS